MKTTEELYKDLDKYKDFSEGDNDEKFLDVVDEIVLRQDPSSIPILLKYLDDHCESDYVDETLYKKIEYYPTEPYVRSLLTNMDILIPHAIGHLKSLICRLMNSETHYAALLQNIPLAPRDSFIQVLDAMSEDEKKGYLSAHQIQKINQLREMLEKE